MTKRLIVVYGIAMIGGVLFYFLKIPLPWVLGPVTSLVLYKFLFNKPTTSSNGLKQVSFVLLGMQIGLSFQENSLSLMGPYILPYVLCSIVLITISLVNGYLVSRWINVDTDTSLLGSIPGGLSATIALSDSMKSNTVLVTIFHSIRLVAVLFIVPFLAAQLMRKGDTASTSFVAPSENGDVSTVFLYVVAYGLAYVTRRGVPASFVIFPVIFIAVGKALGISMYVPPDIFFLAAQLTLGVYLGDSIHVKDIQNAGKYCVIYFGLSIWLIIVSFGIGYIFSEMVGLSLATAILSVAPGGMVEMALTAQTVGGDPAVVSSLQMIRLLLVVVVVPIALKWIIQHREPATQSS
ncbi:AbrB family transcriptional regulator [Pontibacillus salicampi]|uniref:AbrB family transcriptional regulator n=1 Tax=Pontibacillus salicampi TaxID=1449801 RepID=A0ABV6LLQ9_9BACI